MNAFDTVRSFSCACAIVLAGAVAFATEPCISSGTVRELVFDRPTLGWDGCPTSAEWVDGDGDGSQDGAPSAAEHDGGGFLDDAMGAATPGDPPDTASVSVENKGDDNLSGPNGEVQNGGLEGECIEVWVCWKYRYKVKVKTCPHHEGEPCEEIEVWRSSRICVSPPKEICPC